MQMTLLFARLKECVSQPRRSLSWNRESFMGTMSLSQAIQWAAYDIESIGMCVYERTRVQ